MTKNEAAAWGVKLTTAGVLREMRVSPVISPSAERAFGPWCIEARWARTGHPALIFTVSRAREVFEEYTA